VTVARRAHAPAGSLTLPADAHVRLAFTDRAFGNVSHVVGNGAPAAARARLEALAGVRPGDSVYMEQVHGAVAARVGRAHRGRGRAAHSDALRGADALVTTEPGIALVALVADCVPLLVTAPGRGVAAVHAGRRGVAADVVGAAVDMLARAAEVEPDALVAVAGPAIGGCCYELPAALADELGAATPGARTTTTWGAPSVDLRVGVDAQLRAAGVERREQIGACTACHADGWFSHRATTAGRAPAGRQAAVIARLPGAARPPSIH
jgi:polyphenol oxidase